nr:MAG TPA: hypothetical protein [Caudoviricetes sp.]DAS01867.1 MAG TPA: hypothetical protein [Caudoviricetes sp.]
MFFNTRKNGSKSHEKRPKEGICRKICIRVVLIHYNYTQPLLQNTRPNR